jgi:hypothetical protein
MGWIYYAEHDTLGDAIDEIAKVRKSRRSQDGHDYRVVRRAEEVMYQSPGVGSEIAVMAGKGR